MRHTYSVCLRREAGSMVTHVISMAVFKVTPGQPPHPSTRSGMLVGTMQVVSPRHNSLTLAVIRSVGAAQDPVAYEPQSPTGLPMLAKTIWTKRPAPVDRAPTKSKDGLARAHQRTTAEG
jgi:hypothetical protein